MNARAIWISLLLSGLAKVGRQASLFFRAWHLRFMGVPRRDSLVEHRSSPRSSGDVVPLDRGLSDLRAVIDGAARGEAASVLIVHDRFGPMVNRLVWRLLGADGEHDDVVHDVFVNVLESIGAVKSPVLLEEWIAGVTVNTVRRELRRRAFYRIFRFGPGPARELAVSSNAEARLALKRFYEVLDGMAANDRIVFALRFVEGRSLAEIGAVCGCSLAAVKRRLKRARARFERAAGGEFCFTRDDRGDGDD